MAAKELLQVLAAAGVAILGGAQIRAQSQAAKPPAFDVASVRLDSGPPRAIEITPGSVRGSASLRGFIRNAYGLSDYQVSGGPGWLETEGYRIEAKADGVASPDRLKEMLQTLLQDRFKLVVHRETKNMPVYFLVVARGGPKLRELKEGDPLPAPRPRKPGATGGITFRGGLQAFADALSHQRALGRPVLDKTGLKGKYLTSLEWGPDEDLFTAMQEDLGLRIEAGRASIELLTIDHVEKPSEN